MFLFICGSDGAVNSTSLLDIGRMEISGQRGATQTVSYDMSHEFASATELNEYAEENKLDTTTYSRHTLSTLMRMDEKKINFDLIEELLHYICNGSDLEGVQEGNASDSVSAITSRGAILISTRLYFGFLFCIFVTFFY